MRYILVTGGVISGLGKGVVSSSLGSVFSASGYHVTHIKIDPYLNYDAGLLSPLEHGEVFVLDDGGEVDLDLGTYERSSGIRLTRDHNITSGKIFQKVIEKERRGDWLGQTVQMVPHVSDLIQEWIARVSKIPVNAGNDSKANEPDVCIIELGGTVGDMESMIYLEAFRQMRPDHPFAHIHVTLVPNFPNEPKTKPTQHSLRDLRATGLQPDVIIARSVGALEPNVVAKMARVCGVPQSHVVSLENVKDLFAIPLRLIHVPRLLFKDVECLERLVQYEAWSLQLANAKNVVKVGIIGKYTHGPDAYLSIQKALIHASLFNGVRVELCFIDSDEIVHNSKVDPLDHVHGILVPGGFGSRGIAGKMLAIRYARENLIPFLGICLGFQLAVLEYARNVMGMEATSEEFDGPSQTNIIQKNKDGKMTLGAQAILLDKDSQSFGLYQTDVILERHRHRYSVTKEPSEWKDVTFSGTEQATQTKSILEIRNHPFYWASQFHPEFTSNPWKPSPPFSAFVKMCAKNPTIDICDP